jgi:hypothetical protein
MLVQVSENGCALSLKSCHRGREELYIGRGTFTGHVRLVYSDKLRFGKPEDLQVRHSFVHFIVIVQDRLLSSLIGSEPSRRSSSFSEFSSFLKSFY